MTYTGKRMIFVFGSNEGGIHGAGAAKTAVEKHGAIMRCGFGHNMWSFAIPTKAAFRNGPHVAIGNTLSIPEIKVYVDAFLAYAKAQHDMTFQITQLGCGLAGLKAEDVAPLFKDATENCYFDEAWKPILGPLKNYWGTFP